MAFKHNPMLKKDTKYELTKSIHHPKNLEKLVDQTRDMIHFVHFHRQILK